MGRLSEMAPVFLLIMFLLNTELTWAKRGGGSRKTSSSSSRGRSQSKPSGSQPTNNPRPPIHTNRNTNPYLLSGGRGGGTNTGGNTRWLGGNQGGSLKKKLGSASTNQRGHPNLNPAAGSYPARRGNTGQGWGQPKPNIRSPDYGGRRSYGNGGQGMGGSPFSRTPYEKFMERCMNRTDTATPKKEEEEDDDTVSIEEIGYPALIKQVKSRRCDEKYKALKRFLERRKALQQQQQLSKLSNSSPLSYGVIQLFTSFLMLLSSMLLLQ